MDEQPDAEVLAGGNASGEVVRVGNTVRKPWLPTTPHTVAYLESLRQQGIDVPRSFGRDGQGRLVLEFVPGAMAIDMAPLPDHLVRRVGRLVRTIHDASANLPVPEGWPPGVLPPPVAPVGTPADHDEPLLCHNDLATWNLVVDGSRLVFIDWDGAGPSTRSWDLAYAAIAFAHLFPDAEPTSSARRLAAFVDGYGADPAQRAGLPRLMAQRSRAMYCLLQRSHDDGTQPWATMFLEGHGEHWLSTTRFIEQHQDVWAAALR